MAVSLWFNRQTKAFFRELWEESICNGDFPGIMGTIYWEKVSTKVILGYWRLILVQEGIFKSRITLVKMHSYTMNKLNSILKSKEM